MEGRHSKTARKATEPPSGGTPSKRLPSKKAGLGELEGTHLPSTLTTGKPFTRIPTTSTSFMEAGLGTIDSVKNQLTRKRYLELSEGDDSFAAYFIALKTLGEDVMRKGPVVGETLDVRKAIDASASSSHAAKSSLLTRQNLESSIIEDVDLDDDSYKRMSASQSKVRKGSVIGETLSIGTTSDTSISSSYLAAIGLFTLQNLKSLNILHRDLDDDFYKGMCAASPQSKIERFRHNNMAPLGPDASLNYAKGLFSMPNLLSLDLHELKLSDEFYSCMATEASKSKIERFTHQKFLHMAPLGPDASLNYARGLFSMPNLLSLDLDGQELSDEFYLCMATEASKSKIERFIHYSKGSLGPAASLNYTRGLFSMPNLQSLTLNGLKLSDEFYSSMGTEASKSKIQTLDMKNVSMTQRILHTFLSLPCLQSLRLERIDDVDKNDKEMLTSHSTSVEELSLDGRDVTTLWKLGLHTSCPQVQILNLRWYYKKNVSSEIVTMACSPFHHLTHLNIRGYDGTIDPESFSIAGITSCPQLTKLSLTYIELGNEKATEIIQSMKTHPHLSSIQLHWCRTDMGLDPLIDKVNSEGKLTVTVKHNPMKVSKHRKQIASVTEKKTSPSLQVSAADDVVEATAEMKIHEDETGTQGEEKGEKDEEEEDQYSTRESFHHETDDLVGATAGIHIHEDDETDTQEEENEGETKEVEEDQYSATANFPDETVPDEDNVPPIEMECHKSVGVEGEKLQLDSFGIELEIPPGAIGSEMPQDISLRVLTDTPNLGDSKEEMSVCFGVQCLGPHGMVLKSPVTFTIPHCAIISRPYGIQAVLYCGEGEYTPGAVVKERIELPLSGTLSCIIMEDVLKFRVNHFSWWFFTFSKNDSLQGKRLCCLPMVCTKMPVERTPIILHTHLYDDIKGNREYGVFHWIKSFFAPEEKWLEEELNEAFKKVHSETQILVEPSGEDMKLTCSVNEETGQKKNLSYNKICSLSHNCVPFQLDLRKHSDNVAVLLKVGQEDETELLCPVQFTPDRGSKSSHKESKICEAKTLAGQKDFDNMLKTVAKRVRKNDEIDNLGKALDFDPGDISSYIATNMRDQNVSYMGTLSMLRDWQKKQTKDTECESLNFALKEAGQIRLADELFGTK